MERSVCLAIDIKEKAIKAAEKAVDKKAINTVILELKDITTIADYFVICSGENPAQIRAIADAIDEYFSKEKIKRLGKEGLGAAHWVLLDYGDIIIHIFNEEMREFYDLEKFWIDAPRVAHEELDIYASKR